ncbi:MAG: hypothetical protein IPM22_01640 [Betaproteobacteria bacterium]|nr:hypothetical protein [Betaproteobacteria bacterium]
MTNHRARMAAAAVLLVAACQQPAPPPPAAADPQAARPGVVASAPAARPAASPPPAKVALPRRDFLPGPLYYCAIGDVRAAIEYEPRVESLCRKHPEMGPCQYERNACRVKGGRVYTARGEEVSPGVEKEYDQAVVRVRFQADGGAKR